MTSFTMNGTGEGTSMATNFSNVGQQFHADSTEGALLIGQTITNVQFLMKNTAGITDTTAKCFWFNSGGVLQATSSDTYNTVSNFTTSYAMKSFTFNYTVSDGDICAVGTDATISSGELYIEAGSNTYSNTGQMNKQISDGSWVSRSRDCNGIWTYSTPSSGATFFPPPPAYVRL